MDFSLKIGLCQLLMNFTSKKFTVRIYRQKSKKAHIYQEKSAFVLKQLVSGQQSAFINIISEVPFVIFMRTAKIFTKEILI